MLNELKMLADSIRSAGISGEEWDNHFKCFKTGKKSPCFIVTLLPQGEIKDIRFVEPEKARFLRTWEKSNGLRFPCFNFIPFYDFLPNNEKVFSSKQKNEAIKTFAKTFIEAEEFPRSAGTICFRERKTADARTEKCLGTIADDFFGIVTKDMNEDDPLVQLNKAVFALRSTNFAEAFNRKLLHFLHEHLSLEMATQKDPSTIWSLLFCQTNDVVLFFDVVSDNEFSIASEVGIRTINTRLLKQSEASSLGITKTKVDAFGAFSSLSELSENLPEVKVPIAGNIILRCMNGESPCQYRYGHVAAESFPVGATVRKETKSAIAWIASPEREGKTWAIAGTREVVFAYPKSLPSSAPPIARLLGIGKQSSPLANLQATARFEDYAQAALNGLKTLGNTTSSNTEIEVFALKKADAASKRAKVVFYRNYSLAKLEAAVSAWLAGADNIPPILLRKWPPKEKGEKAPKGTKPVTCEFRAPLPLAATGLVYAMWSQDGNEKFEPKYRSASLYDGFPVFDGLELFLGESVATGLAERMLSLLLQGSGSLCAASGNLARKHEILSNARAVAHLETSLPLFGILLHKLNRTKENYMENAPYLIGRFLNLADGLHAVWCRNVKDKDPLPPQLLGSSLFASFQLNPVQGFANAGMRMKPYIDWAKTNQTGDVALSRWFVGEFGRITAAIEKAGIPVRLSDADKAEMLLGYLSSAGKSAESDPSGAGTVDANNSL